MDHHVFGATGWKNVQSPSHPTLSLRLSVDAGDYAQFGYKCPEITPTKVKVIVDSGAQSVLWSRREYLSAGFTMNDLIPVKHNMKAANGVNIQIDGAVLIRLSGKLTSGDPMSCAVMAYVSPDANYLYLSKEAMIQLQIIDPEFPKIGAVSSNQVSGIDEETDYGSVYAECGCLKREMPPEKPSRLPFDPSQENDAAGMKEWLLSRYASSTFNKCPLQLLPLMDGPPIEIHIGENAKPVAFLKPRPVALHWQKKIEEDLLRDVSLGVIERVPHGEPTSWCFPMLAARKDDGSPRRLVDLSPLNKFCKREVHTSKSPFNLAKSVPSNSLKTVVDAWNGYHAIPVKESDRKYLTFATNLGLFRYMRAPQGFLSSGDGYNRRLDDLTSHIQRLERCVDDSLLHDKKEDVDQHWWRVIEYLELCGKSGIVLNPEKFQFSLSTVDFAGFRISEDTVEPLPKYLDAIRGFPTPCTIRDIRSWFGLVHQVAHYAQLRDMLEPFKKFLSPKVKFEWNAELDGIFERSKLQIIDAIKKGVQIYDMTKRTCLRTDWSRSGIGYLLAQKHCHCKGGSYSCCPDGWRITLAGSRFLTPAEKNYAPIEGEALAVAWALKQTEFFTQGCDNLVVVVDHKPLVKILGDRRLDEIENSRLFRIKWKTLNWRFDIEYQRGERNPFADAMSRNPNTYAELASIGMQCGSLDEEESLISSIGLDVEKVTAITWDLVKAESAKDESLCALRRLTVEGFPSTKDALGEENHRFWEIREHLSVADDVLLYKDRIVIPKSLRTLALKNLHSAHQGVTSMTSRASIIMYWPGMAADIDTARSACKSCNRNAPSQTKLPPTAPKLPTTPFEMIAADYFELMAKHFLVVADRLSGWTEVVQTQIPSVNSGSKGLCDALRRIFVTFGAPDEISTDGGPEFTAAETEEFLQRWGVHHRLSSAYCPQSNGRAEVAVRVTKRLLEENMDKNGNLNNDKVARALLQQRNTPDKDCGLSPAQVLFGRQLKDTLPTLDKSVMVFENKDICNQWHEAWAAKEDAIRVRLVRSCENLEPGSRELIALKEGDRVLIQNQAKNRGRPNKWDRQGVIIAVKGNDQCLVKVDGTGRLTLRNRRYLRRFEQPCSMGNSAQPDSRKNSRSGELRSNSATEHQHREPPADMPTPLYAGSGALDQSLGNMVDDHAAEAEGNTARNAVGDASEDDAPRGVLINDDQGVATQVHSKRGPGRPRKRVSFNFTRKNSPCTPITADRPRATCPEENLCKEVRRSTRDKTRTQIYDASTGKSMDPSP